MDSPKISDESASAISTPKSVLTLTNLNGTSLDETCSTFVCSVQKPATARVTLCSLQTRWEWMDWNHWAVHNSLQCNHLNDTSHTWRHCTCDWCTNWSHCATNHGIRYGLITLWCDMIFQICVQCQFGCRLKSFKTSQLTLTFAIFRCDYEIPSKRSRYACVSSSPSNTIQISAHRCPRQLPPAYNP